MTMKWKARTTCIWMALVILILMHPFTRDIVNSFKYFALKYSPISIAESEQMDMHVPKRVRYFIQSDFRSQFTEEKNADTQLFREKNSPEQGCYKPRLKNRMRLQEKGIKTNMSCIKTRPIAGSCKVAKQMFQFKPRICPNTDDHEMCSLLTKNKEYQVRCNLSRCSTQHPFLLGIVNENSGQLEWTPNNISSLKEQILETLYLKNVRKNFGFCIIKCLKISHEKHFKSESVNEIPVTFVNVQILLLPLLSYHSPISNTYHENQFDRGSFSKMPHPNINLILLDSVSRNHFYRSLPSTIKVLDQLNHVYSTVGNSSIVLDFELVQAIKSRTFETLQALFTGEVNIYEKPFGTLAMPPTNLGTHVLMHGFKKQGYETLWLEDLCWQWEWGLSKNFRVFNKSESHLNMWKQLKQALNRAGIDNIDLTLSNCEIFKFLDINDHFQGPDVVCYGSKFQHEYLLEYLQLYQMHKVEKSEPFFSFMSNSVGHEHSGRRLQTSDAHLSKYLQFASQLPNTFTLIFADHGNAYGDFIRATFEGRLETFHPFMFMILPHDVQKYLGQEKLSSLIRNQERLVSWLDVHYLLRVLGNIPGGDVQIRKQFAVHEYGLLSPVKTSRNCEDMPRIAPNFCICEGFENAVANDSTFAIYAHYALALMNEGIQQYIYHNPQRDYQMYGNCQRLQLYRFHNVYYSMGQKNITVKMDIITNTWSNSTWREVFGVEISLPHTDTGLLKLMKYDRISQYSRFSQCADDVVPVNLCICSKEQVDPWELELGQKDATLATYKVELIREDFECLYLLSTFNTHGFVTEVFNFCLGSKDSFNITIEGEFFNLALSITSFPHIIHLRVGESRILLAAVQKDTGTLPKWSYKIYANSL